MLLRIVLDENRKRISLDRFSKLVASEVIRVESLRRIGNTRLAGEIDDDQVSELRETVFELLPELGLVRLTRSVLARAARAMGFRVIGDSAEFR